MRTPVIIFILWLSFSSKLAGQSYVGGAGMINAGYMWSPTLASSLRSLTGNSLDFRKGYIVAGAEINYRNNKTVFALSGYIGTQEAKRAGDRLIEPFMLKTHASVGWMIFGRKSLFIYPVVGAGIMETSLTYHAAGDSEIHILTRAPSMEISIHSDYFFDKIRSDHFINVAMVSLRAGYTRGLSSSRLPGWSVTLSFGGLAFMKNKS